MKQITISATGYNVILSEETLADDVAAIGSRVKGLREQFIRLHPSIPVDAIVTDVISISQDRGYLRRAGAPFFMVFIAPPVQHQAITDEAKKAKLQELIMLLAADCKEAVEQIEAKVETTQNHYGDYMALICTLSAGGGYKYATIIAQALILAGANRQGVMDAMRVSF